jgi:PleD family two-component response regulator
VTISPGVSGYNYQLDDLDAILIRLNHALYKAKRSGRDRVALST